MGRRTLRIWAACFCAGAMWAQSQVTLTIDTHAAGAPIPADFLGLSFETSNLLQQPGGGYIFSPGNGALIALFRTLGIRNLRLGGATADMPRYAVPGEEDIDNLFAFAAAADVKVIYTLRLPRSDAARNAAIAEYIERRYGPRLRCFEIGNEPDYYRRIYREIPDYATYSVLWKEVAAAVTGAAPKAKFCGPAAGGMTSWSRSFAADFAKSGRIAAVAQHEYPGENGAYWSGAPARDEMLSRAWMEKYDRLYHSFASTALAGGLPYRLEETNNYTGGAKEASDTFAAALWALDYLHWWAARGAAGINFHNRRWILNTTIYPVDARDDGLKSGYEIHPIGYGLKAFDLGGYGSPAAVSMRNPDAVNLTAYAVRQPDNLFLTVINKKDPGASPRDAKVTIALPLSSAASVMFLAAPDNDVAAKTGITLGGASITGGSWHGTWATLPPDRNGHCTVMVRGSSAAIIRLPLH